MWPISILLFCHMLAPARALRGATTSSQPSSTPFTYVFFGKRQKSNFLPRLCPEGAYTLPSFPILTRYPFSLFRPTINRIWASSCPNICSATLRCFISLGNGFFSYQPPSCQASTIKGPQPLNLFFSGRLAPPSTFLPSPLFPLFPHALAHSLSPPNAFLSLLSTLQENSNIPLPFSPLGVTFSPLFSPNMANSKEETEGSSLSDTPMDQADPELDPIDALIFAEVRNRIPALPTPPKIDRRFRTPSIPDVTVIFEGDTIYTTRDLFRNLGLFPSLGLGSKIREEFFVGNRAEFYLNSTLDIQAFMLSLSRLRPLLCLYSEKRTVRIIRTYDYRFFRVTLLGLPSHDTPGYVQLFLSQKWGFPREFLKNFWTRKPRNPNEGGVATLLYSIAPAEFYSGALPDRFPRLDKYSVSWKVPAPLAFLKGACRFCRRNHYTAQCFRPYLDLSSDTDYSLLPEEVLLTEKGEAPPPPLPNWRDMIEKDAFVFTNYEEEEVLYSPSVPYSFEQQRDLLVNSLPKLFGDSPPSSSSSSPSFPAPFSNFLMNLPPPTSIQTSGSKRKSNGSSN